MVSQDQGIESHGVHQLDGGLSLGHIGPIVPLDHISGGKQKRRLFLAQGLNLAPKIGNPSQEFLGTERFIGFGETVKVIDMKNPQVG